MNAQPSPRFKKGDQVRAIWGSVRGTVKRVDWRPANEFDEGTFIVSLVDGNYGGEGYFLPITAGEGEIEAARKAWAEAA